MIKLTHEYPEWLGIMRAFDKLRQDHSNYGHVHEPLMFDAIIHLHDKIDSGDAYVGHGYLLLVSVVNPWYNHAARILQEELVLRISNDAAHPGRVVDFLSQLALERNCSGVYAGDSTNDQRMSKLYQRKQFSPAGSLLYKPIKGNHHG